MSLISLGSLRSLSSNITEICHADRYTSPASFVVGVGGDIWDAKSKPGRFLNTAYKVSDFFRSRVGDFDGSSKNQLYRAMRKLHCNFIGLVLEIRSNVYRAEAIFKRVCRSTSKLKEMAPFYSEFNNVEHHLGHLFRGSLGGYRLGLLEREFMRFLGIEHCLLEDTTKVFQEVNNYCDIMRIRSLLNYDGSKHQIFPIDDLCHYAYDEPVNDAAMSRLRDFVRRLCCFRDDISLCNLWRLFVVILRCYRDDVRNDEVVARVVRLGRFLEDNDFKIYDKKDQCHVKWIGKISRRIIREITINSKKVELRGLIAVQKSHGDNHVVFSIKDDLDNVFVTSTFNPFKMALEHIERYDGNWGLPLVETKAFDMLGYGTIVERLDDIVSEHFWPDSMAEFTTEDRERLEALQKFVADMVKRNSMPEGLTTRALMFNYQNEIRFIKVLKCETFDFLTMEEFIWESANNREYIYKYLMFGTGIHDHKIMTFCGNMFERMLCDDVVDIVRETILAGIDDPRIADALTELQANIVKVRDGITAKVKKKTDTLSDVPSRVVDFMREKYAEDGSGFIFMPSLKRRIVTKLLQKR